MKEVRSTNIRRILPTITTTAFCILALAGVQAQSIPQNGWYASDSLGMASEPVTGPSDSSWTLHIKRLDDSITMRLYREGEPFKTTLREYTPDGILRREAVESGQALEEESSFDAEGRPLLSRLFLPGGMVEETRYQYVEGRLLSRETTSGTGSMETTNYLYAPDGRLVSAKSSSGAFYGSGKTTAGVASTWNKGPEGLELRSYDAAGRLAMLRLYDGTSVKRSETRSWSGDRLEKSTIVSVDGTTTTTMYAVSGLEAGSIVAIHVERNGKIISSEKKYYDEAGRLHRVETEANSKQTAIEYAFDAQGMLSGEKHFIGRQQVLVIRYESKTDRIEETYNEGGLIARVSYSDGKRFKEELFKDGILIRTRLFE